MDEEDYKEAWAKTRKKPIGKWWRVQYRVWGPGFTYSTSFGDYKPEVRIWLEEMQARYGDDD